MSLSGLYTIEMKTTILVYGWYNQGNIGDELFKQAFAILFPNYHLVFTPRITIALLKGASAVFIGGGSFLFAPPNMADGSLDILKQKKIFYLGVGAETEIHPVHRELMAQAQLIAIRSTVGLDEVKDINKNTICIPDIVYCLQSLVQKSEAQDKSVLIMPNLAVVPQWTDPHWKHVAWEYFKSEFSQYLDFLVDEKYTVKFLAMCQNKKTNDHWAAIELINKMKNRKDDYLLEVKDNSISTITSIMSEYQTVITQRFHGIVLAEMIDIPVLAISHHDKLNYGSNVISYYGTNKQILNNCLSNLKIEKQVYCFDLLQKSVNKLISST